MLSLYKGIKVYFVAPKVRVVTLYCWKRPVLGLTWAGCSTSVVQPAVVPAVLYSGAHT
jgi:hypothetical protein